MIILQYTLNYNNRFCRKHGGRVSWFFGILMPLIVYTAALNAPAASAADFFPVFNQGSLQRSATLPALGEARLLKSSDSGWYTALDLTTEYYADSNANEELLEDGESARLALSYRAALAKNWEYQIEVPVLVQGGGFLDGPIEDWHGFFGLPNGGRELAPQDRYRYRYVRNGVTLLDVRDSGTVLGDVRVGTGWRVSESTALRGLLKLPTGDESSLSGGNAGAALWFDHAMDFGPASRWSSYLSGGASLSEESKILAGLQNSAVVFVGGGIACEVFNRLQLIGQIYAHSPLYKNTELDGLKNPGLQLLLGSRWKISETLSFLLAFQEDPIVSSSPDFSLHFGLSWR